MVNSDKRKTVYEKHKKQKAALSFEAIMVFSNLKRAQFIAESGLSVNFIE